MIEPLTLTDEQEEAVASMLLPSAKGGCLMASELGTGKTCVVR